MTTDGLLINKKSWGKVHSACMQEYRMKPWQKILGGLFKEKKSTNRCCLRAVFFRSKGKLIVKDF